MDTRTLPDSGATLPRQHTSFIGRETEIAAITALLDDPHCRLLTLVGPGGSGKTRLAVEVARQVAFRDGVYFVPLQPLDSPDHLVSTIATTVSLYPDDSLPLKPQLLDFLSQNEILLVLDNLEHLLESAELVAEILEDAQGIKILVTSREVLNLHEEWMWEVHGLPYPTDVLNGHNEDFTALQLFAERARQISPEFSLTAESVHVAHICQLVDGMPLALELAAGWLRSLSCQDIVSEIQRNLDFLTSKSRNVPEQHRSMRAVFDHSWRLLSNDERAVMGRMSVFRGGCTREAAEQIAGATLPVLAALVDKSMLRRDPVSGRYDIQELLRQYAEEQLTTSGEAEVINDRHTTYYSAMIGDLSNNILRKRSHVLDSIGADFENIRDAWHWALVRDDYGAIDKLIEATWQYSADRGFCVDAQDLYEAARDKLVDCQGERQRATLGRILGRLGKCYAATAKWEQATCAIRQAIDIARSSGDLSEEAEVAMPWLAISLWNAGQHDEARKVMAQAIVLSRQLNSVPVLNLLRLADFEGGTGHLDKCWKLLEEASALSQDVDNYGTAWPDLYRGTWALRDGQWHQAIILLTRSHQMFVTGGHHKGGLWGYNRQGRVALATGDIDKARQIAESALLAAKKTENMSAIANRAEALCTLSLLTDAHDDHPEASRLAHDALNTAERLGDIFIVAPAKFAMGWAGLNANDKSAVNNLCESLDKALLWQSTGDLLYHAAAFARILAQRNHLTRAAELLGLVFTHPNSPQGYLERHRGMTRLRVDLEAHLGANSFSSEWEHGAKLDVEQVARDLLHEFSAGANNSIAKANQVLDNPLTARELDVLGLLAEGLTNPQIAERLFITTGTVKGHVNKILQKLDAADRQAAVVQARTQQLLKA